MYLKMQRWRSWHYFFSSANYITSAFRMNQKSIYCLNKWTDLSTLTLDDKFKIPTKQMVSSPEERNTLFSLWSLSYSSPFIPNNTMDDINFCSSEYLLSRRSDQIMSRKPLCPYIFACRLFNYWHIHTEFA